MVQITSDAGYDLAVSSPSEAVGSLRAGSHAELGTFEQNDENKATMNTYGLVGNHEYNVQGTYVDPTTNETMVQLRNPWGSSQPRPIPLSKVDEIFDQGIVISK